jgi:CheY-like chemotaxis protein
MFVSQQMIEYSNGLDSKVPLILVVAVDPLLRFLWCQQLKEEGYQVLSAESSTKGLDLYSQFCPDLVLIDVELSDKDGFNYCRQLREFSPTLPIILAGGANTLETIEQAEQVGATLHISKPVQWSVLHLRIHSLLYPVLTFTNPENSAPDFLDRRHPSKQTQRVFDANPLMILSGTLGQRAPELIRNWVQDYLRIAPELLQSLSVAIATQDLPKLQLTAMILECDSNLLGAIAIARLCQDLKAMGQNGNLDNAIDTLKQLEITFESTQIVLGFIKNWQ